MEVEAIIQGCINNDRVSQEKLYRQYFPTMMSMCMRYINDRDRSAAIVNDGFLKVFTKIQQYTGRGSFEGWVRRIVFRSLSDAIRKDAKYIKFMVFDSYDVNDNTSPLDKLHEEDLLKLIDVLPPASGDVFILYAIQGYSHKEIAKMRGINVGTSKWHLSEARRRLRELIKTESQSNAG